MMRGGQRHGARKAFTIIELLVVITVLLILMGMLVPAVMHVRKVARRKLARTQLAGLCVAIERYFLQLGIYPPSTGFPPDPDRALGASGGWDSSDPALGKYSLYWHLCGPDGDGIPYKGRTYGPYRELEERQYEDDGTARIILDPWGNPWIYQENWSESMKKVGDPNFKAHKKRYDVLSRGPDGVMSAENLDFFRGVAATGDEKDDDDIANWD